MLGNATRLLALQKKKQVQHLQWICSFHLIAEMKHSICKLQLFSTSPLFPFQQLGRVLHWDDKLYLKTYFCFPVVAFEGVFK